MLLLFACFGRVVNCNKVIPRFFIYVQSLACKDKAQALSVLGEMKMILPVRSDLFAQVVRLSDKLEKEKIDYAYEMSAIGCLTR